jgi:signal transduction histidine kinase
MFDMNATRHALRREPFVPLTVAAAIVALTIGLAFLWLRATLPSEPAVVSSDDWPWIAEGVAVRPIGDSPFRAGDVVVAIDGRSLEAWAEGAASARSGRTGPLPAVMTFDVVRDGHRVALQVPMDQPSLVDLLAPGVALLIFTIAQLVVAVLAWLRRPGEGWRQGFLLGSVGNFVSAVGWELGVQPTDLVRSEPTLLLFSATGPLHLLFWSSIVHVIGSFPARSDLFAGRPWLVAAVYGLPQLALPAGIAIARLTTSTTLVWIDRWATVLEGIVLIMLLLTIAATANAYRHWPLDQRRDTRPLAVAIVAVALAVLLVTVLPALIAGRPLAPRSAVAVLGLPAVLALIVAIARNRLFEVAVLDASRRRLVIAREEERRRIRRDLHDGLGPMLAAMTLKLDLTRDQVRADPATAESMLDELKADTKTAVAEIRRLVRELRPPALDELGLVEAIRQRAGELAVANGSHTSDASNGSKGNGRLHIAVEAPRALPPLGAAVEVAAYRIAVEAMTNVVRHARASRCIVRLTATRELELEVLDDGVGPDPSLPVGVGLSSMRERTAELGGSCSIDRQADGWTRVVARFPIRS